MFSPCIGHIVGLQLHVGHRCPQAVSISVAALTDENDDGRRKVVACAQPNSSQITTTSVTSLKQADGAWRADGRTDMCNGVEGAEAMQSHIISHAMEEQDKVDVGDRR